MTQSLPKDLIFEVKIMAYESGEGSYKFRPQLLLLGFWLASHVVYPLPFLSYLHFLVKIKFLQVFVCKILDKYDICKVIMYTYIFNLCN